MQRRLCVMSEAKWSITEAKCLQISHNKFASQRDAISPSMGDLILSHSAGMHNSITGICPNKFERAKGSERFHFASLHYIIFCIPAYTHQIPNGISSHRIRDNMYIISKKNGRNAHGCGYALNPSTHIVSVSHFAPPSSLALLAARRPKRP